MMCPDVEFQNELFSYLQKHVINLSPKDNFSPKEIEKIYRLWKNDFFKSESETPPKSYIRDRKVISSDQGVPEGSFLLGIDFPIWFNQPGSKPKIMILGIDPLRNEAVFKSMHANRQEEVIIGTPYALHDLKMRNGRQKIYWSLVENLSKCYFVYLTDIYKTFFYIDYPRRIRSYDYYHGVNLSESHTSLLEKEIKLINPDLIITFGGISFAKLMKMRPPKLTVDVSKMETIISKYKTPVLPMVHLSARQKNKLDFLKENGIDDEGVAEGYYLIIKNYLKKLCLNRATYSDIPLS